MTDVVIYTKSYCPYCKAAKALLTCKGLEFEEIEVADDPEALQEMITRSGGRRTVPQIFFGDVHIGGHSDLLNYYWYENPTPNTNTCNHVSPYL